MALVVTASRVSMGQAPPPRFLKVVRVASAPELDGTLDEACWKGASTEDRFYQHKTRQPASRGTSLRMCFDERALYVALVCEDERPDQLVTTRTQRDDPGMWKDSGVELFLKPDTLSPQLLMLPPKEQHVHLILSAKGTRYDQLGTQSSSGWSGHWSSAVARTDTGWTAELAIPFDMMGLTAPKTLALWKAQVARNAHGPREAMTWTPTGAIYREHSRFGALVFVPDAGFTGNLRREVVMALRLVPAMKDVADVLRLLAELKGKLGADAPIMGVIARLQAQWAKFRGELDKLDDATFLASWQQHSEALSQLGRRARVAAKDATDRILSRRKVKVALYPSTAITDAWITPASLPDLDALSHPMNVRVCPDEFEPATFVIYSPTALDDVAITVETPVCGDKRLPKEAIDVRVVKCWYQKAPTSIQGGQAVLLPELLLKDPGLVVVDHDAQANKVGKQGLWSHPDDARTLQPFSIPARSAQQIWLTVHPPAGAPPGTYVSAVKIASADGTSASIPLTIGVLDFDLEPSVLDHGLYNVNRKWGTQDEDRVLSEMRNLREHGITHAMVRDPLEHYGRIVRLMQQTGLRTDRFFTFGFRLRRDKATGKIQPIEGFKEAARRHVKAAKDAGAGDVYIYLIDEATGQTLARERSYAQAVRDVGGKTAVACNSAYFDVAGDFIDAPIVASAPMSREQVDAIHAKGARIYAYANPQCGLELPETYRRNFGLLLWQAGYDGAMNFAYYWPFGSVWNDFDHASYKDHCMVYPTKTGVIDTIQWEGWREGADDCRYLATLLKAIGKAGDTGAARRARQWVDKLRQGGGERLKDLDDVRATMIEHIRACRR